MGEIRSSGMTLKAMVETYERRIIEDALRAAGGNQRRAARNLGVLPTTLHEKMKRMGLLPRPSPAVASPGVAHAMPLAG